MIIFWLLFVHISKIFAQIFAQLFAQIFRLKNIRANFCAIICSNFWVKTNFRQFFFCKYLRKIFGHLLKSPFPHSMFRHF